MAPARCRGRGPVLPLALALALGLLAAAAAKTLERDVFALLALYAEVNGRDPEWTKAMAKWPVATCDVTGACGTDPCGFEWQGDGWEGVSCRYQENWDKSIPRVVTNFHLPKRGLTGPLPKALALLANVTELDFDTNKLSGPLPPEWGCLRNLVEIDLTKNQLTGAIPQQWGLLHGLIEMELDGNAGLSGCVPEGTPPFERWCGTFSSVPCVAFTTDRLLGTSTTGSAIRGRCAPHPGGDAALASGLRCPTVEDQRQPLTRLFAQLRRQGQGQRQGMQTQPAPTQGQARGAMQQRPAALGAALDAAAASDPPEPAFTPVAQRNPGLFSGLLP
ncbi:hypothetical protein HYH03_009515 [Edaphochlamys debaryana]|uniref:Uncharacterized protein n=1 Tax=Edaphochlamys debaryana TaxID=47281 RepID=A0A835Y4C5_9CHLO|nr:hypothetical protein HYH03_009515 [Edaphochlamys debaryana]|eukprot:KAG2492275.1 hypothetical protein HYH03_009515 [Edaphochlamys debaryana]